MDQHPLVCLKMGRFKTEMPNKIGPVHGGSVPQPAKFEPFDRREIEQSIPSRFEQLARREPNRLAVKTRTETLTYGALNDFAGRTASAILQAAGSRPQPIALLLGQSACMVAAILGVLKAGHFYVPLDASYPEVALLGMLADCGAQHIVTDTSNLSLARQLFPGTPPIDIDHLSSQSEEVPPHITADDLAYIYYTSGSTGKPKGVADTHRNVLHNVMRYTNGLYIHADDKLTLLQSPTFSGAVSSLFGALLNGAAIFPYDVANTGIREIGPWLLREHITMYHSVPTIFRHFLRAVNEWQTFDELRVVRLEGDRASPTDIDLFRKHFTGDAVVSHGLGATECGLVSRFIIDRHTEIDGPVVPIGFPVEDVTICILDEKGCQVANGESGEIAVESRYLSPGYWNRTDLTEKVFGAGREPGTRLYRTGDVGRLRPDGCLEHLGRRDFQPKLRGQRVDAEGVEAAILETGLAAEAVVEIRNGPLGEGRLVAYVVPSGNGAISAAALRQRLASRLPANLIPARIVVIDALPLTSNLKVDRKALPSPDSARPQLDVPFIAPGQGIEATMASIWSHVLGLDQIGVRDDFFDLGGDSLGATLVIEGISRELGVELPPQMLFEAPTIEGLARAVDECRSHSGVGGVGGARTKSIVSNRRSPLVAVQPNGSRRPFFFLHAEYGGDGFYCLNLARHLGTDQPFFALSPHGRDGERMPFAIETMAADHLKTLREVQRRGPYLLGGFCTSAVVAWEMGCQLREAGEAVDLLVIMEPPSVRKNYLWRAVHTAAGALVALKGGGPEERLSLVTRAARLRRLARKIRWREMSRGIEIVTDTSRVSVPQMGSSDPREQIAQVYSRAVAGFHLRRFDGPVLCLRAGEEPRRGSTEEWRRLAREFTESLVPGDHNSCIITHARSLAEQLGAGLATANMRQ